MEENFINNEEIKELEKITNSYIINSTNDQIKAKDRIKHGKMVSELCVTIGMINKMDINIINDLQIAGLMHDICKFEEKDIHSYLGSIKAYDIIKNRIGDIEKAKRVCNIIATHSEKEYYNKKLSLQQKILINADIISKLMIDEEILELYKKDIKEMDKVLNKVKLQKHVIKNIQSKIILMMKLNTFKKIRKMIIKYNKSRGM